MIVLLVYVLVLADCKLSVLGLMYLVLALATLVREEWRCIDSLIEPLAYINIVRVKTMSHLVLLPGLAAAQGALGERKWLLGVGCLAADSLDPIDEIVRAFFHGFGSAACAPRFAQQPVVVHATSGGAGA